jgi:YidC/Oxa1 family membrane protein insertase
MLADGSEIRKTVTFAANTYQMGISLALSQPAADGTKAWIEWSRFLPRAMAEDTIDPWTFTSLTDNDKIERTALRELKLDGLSQPAAVQWIALGDKYFVAILAPETRGFNARYGRLGPQYLTRVAGTPTGGTFSLFLGPKDYDLLQSAGTQMERSVDLGFFSFLAYPLLILIRLFHSLFGNYGLAIVGLTLLIKGLFFPLTRASLRSMKALQDLQPEMQALRERIKDPTQLNQELMQLYKRKGVNPLGGCLPILLQIPVFFGLFSALQHSIELRHAPFALWINDLSVPEQFTLLGINIPVMIIVMGVTMFYQQWTTPMPSVDPAQRRMMLWISAVFPISFLIFPFPSGLALYMLTNTSISLVQQAYLRNDAHANPGRATAIASLAIFAVAFALTLI